MTYEEAVDNGARALDEVRPDWYRLINLDELDLASCSACVAGQLARVVGWACIPGDKMYDEKLGFDVFDHTEDVSEDYLTLEELWEDAIRTRVGRDRNREGAEVLVTA